MVARSTKGKAVAGEVKTVEQVAAPVEAKAATMQAKRTPSRFEIAELAHRFYEERSWAHGVP